MYVAELPVRFWQLGFFGLVLSAKNNCFLDLFIAFKFSRSLLVTFNLNSPRPAQ